MVTNLPAMQETWVWSLGWEDPLEKGKVTRSSVLAWRIPKYRGTWWATVHGVTKSSFSSSYWFVTFMLKVYLSVPPELKKEKLQRKVCIVSHLSTRWKEALASFCSLNLNLGSPVAYFLSKISPGSWRVHFYHLWERFNQEKAEKILKVILIVM